MKSKLILCLALVLSGGLFGCSSIAQSVSVADIKITFAKPFAAPTNHVPREVLYPTNFDSVEHGAFTNIVAGQPLLAGFLMKHPAKLSPFILTNLSPNWAACN